MTPAYVSLADFAQTLDLSVKRPDWAVPDSAPPVPLDRLALRTRVEDVVDTVIALQRAEWLQDGVHASPSTAPEVYRQILDAARTLKVSVPPAILTSQAQSGQLTAGTDARPFLVLSAYFFQSADPLEQQFLAGRLVGHVALRQVTTTSLFSLLVDHSGIRQVARRAVGPLLELVLAPIGLGMRLALSRWHRAAELSADRAGLLCCRDVDAAQQAL